jgi:hypothetical protein
MRVVRVSEGSQCSDSEIRLLWVVIFVDACRMLQPLWHSPVAGRMKYFPLAGTRNLCSTRQVQVVRRGEGSRHAYLLQAVGHAEDWQDAVISLGLDIGTVVGAPIGRRGLEGRRRSHERREGLRRLAEEVVQTGSGPRCASRGRGGGNRLDDQQPGVRPRGYCKGKCERMLRARQRSPQWAAPPTGGGGRAVLPKAAVRRYLVPDTGKLESLQQARPSHWEFAANSEGGIVLVWCGF